MLHMTSHKKHLNSPQFFNRRYPKHTISFAESDFCACTTLGVPWVPRCLRAGKQSIVEFKHSWGWVATSAIAATFFSLLKIISCAINTCREKKQYISTMILYMGPFINVKIMSKYMYIYNIYNIYIIYIIYIYTSLCPHKMVAHHVILRQLFALQPLSFNFCSLMGPRWSRSTLSTKTKTLSTKNSTCSWKRNI